MGLTTTYREYWVPRDLGVSGLVNAAPMPENVFLIVIVGYMVSAVRTVHTVRFIAGRVALVLLLLAWFVVQEVVDLVLREASCSGGNWVVHSVAAVLGYAKSGSPRACRWDDKAIEGMQCGLHVNSATDCMS